MIYIGWTLNGLSAVLFESYLQAASHLPCDLHPQSQASPSVTNDHDSSKPPYLPRPRICVLEYRRVLLFSRILEAFFLSRADSVCSVDLGAVEV